MTTIHFNFPAGILFVWAILALFTGQFLISGFEAFSKALAIIVLVILSVFAKEIALI